MSEDRMQFQAEVGRLLEIVAKSLYSEKEVFLRELISNASDACDRLRYAAITQPGLLDGDAEFKVTLIPDAAARTLTVLDNGSGMTRDDLIENLGTIAKSGTRAFAEQMAAVQKTGDQDQALSLIGQFGVGFYSAFMVARSVEVFTRKAGEAQGWRWESDGKGEFTIGETDQAPPRGTRVVIHLDDDQQEFTQPERLRQVVKTHSDHIPIPVVLQTLKAPEEGEEGPGTIEEDRLNRAAALWTRSRSDITADEYKEFYRHVAHAFDDPDLTVHYRAEGMIEYTGLLFVPGMAPWDLFDPARKQRVKLYVRRVMVQEEAETLLPPWLRFLRGIVDSEDLPLNVSRELLQNNPMIAKIRQGLTKRVLGDLVKLAGSEEAEDRERYERVWGNFGAVLKEGLYDDSSHRENLLKLVRVKTTTAEGWSSLAEVIARMPEGQDALYYAAGEDEAILRRSPQLEGFRAKGVEVILLTDPVDEFWTDAVSEVEGKPLKSVTRGAADLSKIKGDAAEADGADDTPAESDAVKALIGRLREALSDAVKDVRPSDRLTDSPVCLVADEGDMDMHLERLLKKHKQIDMGARRILEVNPKHPLIRGIAEGAGAGDDLADLAHLLLDQARIIEGEPVPDPAAFSRRLSSALSRGFQAAA